MLKAEIMRPTIAKRLPELSVDLDEIDKIELAAGFYDVSKWEYAHGGHIRVWFSKPQQGGGKAWVIHRDDFRCDSDLNEIRLDAPYYSRRLSGVNNWWEHSQGVAHAILLGAIMPGAILGELEYILRYAAPEGDGAIWDTHTRALRKFGVESIYAEDLDYSHIERSLRLGFPVPVACLHRGNEHAPIAENCLVIIGFNKAMGYFYVHDSWGKPFSYINENGKNVVLPIYPDFERRWTDGPFTGRGRLITAINGVATGVI